MAELRPGDIVRLDGPPYHSTRDTKSWERQPQPGDMGVVECLSSKVTTSVGTLNWVWVDFPLMGRYCMFPEVLTVVGHVECGLLSQ